MPTVLCLYGASWIESVAGTMIGAGPASVSGTQAPVVTLLIVPLISALVGAVAVRYLLRSVIGCEITLGSAIVALVTGELAATLLLILLGMAVRDSGVLAATGAQRAWFLPGLFGTFVSYQVLQRAQPLWPRSRSLEPYLDRAADEVEPLPTFEDASYDQCVGAVRETSAALANAAIRAERDDVADVILNGLRYMDAATEALGRSAPPAKVPPRLQGELIEAVRVLREDIVESGREAALGNDHYRWRLSDSEGMRKIRAALRELAQLNIAVD